ncbi:MAG: hypothetical protein ACRDV9_06780 [Acidimicrobiia bacterium]
MGGLLVLWALPPGWHQIELAAPDVEERIAERVRSNRPGMKPEALKTLVAIEVEVARQARAGGVVLWADHTEGAGTVEDPLRLIALTLSLTGLPRSEEHAPERIDAGFPSTVVPLPLDDDSLVAFTREKRTSSAFSVQVFLASPIGSGVVALTVSTPVPGWEDQARIVAREVAATVAFFPEVRQVSDYASSPPEA